MHKPQILIADDEPHITHIVGFKLEEAGYSVLVASNGETAFELAVENRPALVVTDFQMPRMSGLELATKLFENEATAEIPVIMVTARGHKVSAGELARTGIRAMLSKPFSPRELIANVAELLGEHQAEAA